MDDEAHAVQAVDAVTVRSAVADSANAGSAIERLLNLPDRLPPANRIEVLSPRRATRTTNAVFWHSRQNPL